MRFLAPTFETSIGKVSQESGQCREDDQREPRTERTGQCHQHPIVSVIEIGIAIPGADHERYYDTNERIACHQS